MRQIESRLDYVFNHDDPYLRTHSREKKKIESLLQQKGKEQLLEETAYIWFNRLTALRFMDNRGYNRVRVVSPADGERQPLILAEIKHGRLPSEVKKAAGQIQDYINGRIETPDPDREAYKTALLEWCNHLGTSMPYLFDRIDDWAALLLPHDLLYKMYEEEGYTIADIPSLIIKNNLCGVDIDDRAAALASFALAMKAREKDRFFFDKGIVPNVIASEEVDVNSGDIKGITFSSELGKSFDYLKDAKNLGSLIPVSGGITVEIAALKEELEGMSSDDFFEKDIIEQLKTGLKQLEYLSPHYHCVVTNPPYMGGKGMNPKLKDFVGKHYPDSKSDLFAVFMEKGLALSVANGYMGMINQQSWMFLSSYEKLREKLINENTIITMAHLGARAFDSIGGEVVQTTAFVIEREYRTGYKGAYIRLVDGKSEAEKAKMFKEAIK
jgi:hypothetical protein